MRSGLRFAGPVLALALLLSLTGNASLAPLRAASLPASGPDVDLSAFFGAHRGAFLMARLDGTPVLRHDRARHAERFAPCSTFKIPNSLIGLQTGVIPDPTFRLQWDGEVRFIPDWNRDHTLASAFEVSAVWYYQELARRVGADRMAELVRRLEYGNMDTSGGLTTFWLGSTLKISIDEQVRFLARLMKSELPVSQRAMRLVREIMIASRGPRAVLRGKTGTDWDPTQKKAILGWYVGAVTRRDGVYVFAANITGGDGPTGRKTRGIVEQILKTYGYL